MIPKSCRLFGQDHAQRKNMIPKMPAPAKAGVADFSDKIMRKIKENRERCRFNLIEKHFEARREFPFLPRK
jgi:hypothetical protein